MEGVPSDPFLRPEDLAPGDRGRAAPAEGLAVARIASAADPAFAPAYAVLWREFGAEGAMESEAVIRERLAWDPAFPPRPGAALAYELLELRGKGRRVALRDHSAAVRLDAAGRPRPGPVVVHLSHAWVDPSQRGRGLAAWLRALPLQAARRCAAALGLPADNPVLLVAEMEAPDPADPATGVRLRSYERGGFRKLDPAAAPWAQPDFRLAEELGEDAPRALPFSLVLRRVGREAETAMPAAEVTALVESLFAIYAVHLPERSLEPLRRAAAAWTARGEPFDLLPPTA